MGVLVCNGVFKEKYGKISFEGLLEQIIQQGDVSEFYFVAATNQLALNFRLDFVQKFFSVNHKPVVNFSISNLEGLIRKIFHHINIPNERRILSESLRFLIFKEAFDESELVFFKRENQDKPPLFLVKWLSQIIFGLKEDGITIDNFEREINKDVSTIVNTTKFCDTHLLFENYQRKLEENKYFDIIDATYFVADWLKEKRNSDFQINKTFVFFGFYDFKVPEIRFLNSLAGISNPVAIYLDFDQSNGPLFGNYADLVLNFKKNGFLALSLQDENTDSNTNFIKKYLFNNYLNQTRKELADKIRIFSAENRYIEAKEIAKLCKNLILREKINPSEICIVTKNPKSYASLFREVFQDAGIPTNITERFRLSSSPLVISLLSAIDVVTRGFRFEDVRKVLLSFYFRFINPENSTPIDVENLLFVATQMRIIGGREFNGKKYWFSRFKNRLDAINQRLEVLGSEENADAMEISSLKLERFSVERARNDFEIFASYFDFPEKDVSFEDFYKIVLEGIIRNFGVLDVIDKVSTNLVENLQNCSMYEKIAKIEEVERDTRALTKFLKLIEEFVFYSSLRYQDRKFTLEEISELFKVIIFEERFQISRKPEIGVNITTIEQTRGIPFKVMILCGAIDGEIPSRYAPEKFLGRILGKSEKRHFENERLEFFFFLTNNYELFDKNERLTYIFYPKRDSKKEFVPSPFIFSLCELIGEKAEDFVFDLTEIKQKKSIPNGMEWVATIPSVVDSNISPFLIGNNEDNTSKRNDVLELYYDKFKENRLLDSKLSENAKDKIKQMVSKPISVSFLEEYAKCPYQFFIDRVLKISKPLPEFEIFLSNRDKGEILHLIVSNFFKKLAQEQAKDNLNCLNLKIGNKEYIPVVLDINKKEYYFQLIEGITKNLLKKYDTEISLFEIDFEEFYSSDPSRVGYVQLWLNYELQRLYLGYNPIFFELGFGLNSKDSFQAVVVDPNSEDSFSFRGKIDRVDFLETKEKIELLVIDYKLKKSDCKSMGEALNGLSFQMPFYALAIEDLFQKNGVNKDLQIILLYQIFDFRISERERRSFYLNYKPFLIQLGSKISENTKVKVEIPQNYELLKNISKNQAKKILNEIAKEKNFPVKPIKDGWICNYCDFCSICKINKI